MNVAYIDNQNLFMATSCHETSPWNVDMRKLRVYLRDKFKIEMASLYMGVFEEEYRRLYQAFRDMGYTVVFREHARIQRGKKKTNVDADIVFEMMLDAYASQLIEKAVLISGDGDYKKVVSHLIDVGKFEKLLLPSRINASSLYKQVPEKFKLYLDDPDIKRKISR